MRNARSTRQTDNERVPRDGKRNPRVKSRDADRRRARKAKRDPVPLIMSSYAHRPAPTGLHAKMLGELSGRSPYLVQSPGGLPNHIVVSVRGASTALWSGHRDAMPARYRGAGDPNHLLSRPASD